MPLFEGLIEKMRTQLPQGGAPVQYRLPMGEEEIPVNALIGSPMKLEHTGTIHCVACGRATKKSFNQGYCYPCFRRLAQCDSCIVSPEKCHFHEGTCREPAWGESHCFIGHTVYLANSSGLKVGITRDTQIPTRWMDQGAAHALPIFRVQSRRQSGFVEVLFKDHVADRTDWRKLLKGEPEPIDLAARRDALYAATEQGVRELKDRFGDPAIERVTDAAVTQIRYPVERYPQKVTSFNLDKTPVAEGTLNGIKGQYLIFDTGVINLRKYAGYRLRLEC